MVVVFMLLTSMCYFYLIEYCFLTNVAFLDVCFCLMFGPVLIVWPVFASFLCLHLKLRSSQCQSKYLYSAATLGLGIARWAWACSELVSVKVSVFHCHSESVQS